MLLYDAAGDGASTNIITLMDVSIDITLGHLRCRMARSLTGAGRRAVTKIRYADDAKIRRAGTGNHFYRIVQDFEWYVLQPICS